MSAHTTAVFDSVIWLVIHVTAGYAAHRLPASRLQADGWWSRERAWESGGRFYERWLRIRAWKRWLPEAGAAFPGGFDKARLRRRDAAYLRTYLRETRRAELGHAVVLAAAPLFFLWNPPWLGWCMQAYALLANLPCMLSQRYNRLRLRRVLHRSARDVAAGLVLVSALSAPAAAAEHPPAPSTPLVDQHGAAISVDALRGRPAVVFVVTARRARLLKPWERALAQCRSRPNVLRVVDVPAGGRAAEVSRMLRKRAPQSVRVAVDAERVFARHLGLDPVEPQVLVLDAAGRMVAHVRGREDPSKAAGVCAALGAAERTVASP